ncbi:MAG: helix-turn-helix domain-containing protein [Candidatus Eremiobacteraeota bacterium]|nr:helix-turn-helix domain-containing protein [Candidatus Eremiobacteraeota bacterium]MCW5869355.1 helix-turn-helix domain-containing protein [Candidatus Eremiobacteraeota bacterium]
MASQTQRGQEEDWPILNKGCCMPEREWSTKQLAELVGLSRATILKDVAKGHLRAHHEGRRLLVKERDFREWLNWRSSQLPQANLRGERLTLLEGAERCGLGHHVLLGAIERGLLPASKRLDGGPARWVIGADDLADFVRSRNQDVHWTARRIAQVTGLSETSVNRALADGQLSFELRTHPRHGPQRVVSEERLVAWLEQSAPPYCKQAAHLPHLLWPEEAAQRFGPELAEVKEHLETGLLAGVAGRVTRYGLDEWLRAQGLSPSWQLDEDSQWISVGRAAELTGTPIVTLQAWVARGLIPRQRRGRRWLLERKSLLDQYDRYHRRGYEHYLTPGQAARRHGVPVTRLLEAMKEGHLPFHLLGQKNGYWGRYLEPGELQEWLARPFQRKSSKRRPAESLPLDCPAFLTQTQAGRATNLGAKAVARALAQGKLEAIAGPDGSPRVKRESLAAWLAQVRVEAGESEEPDQLSLRRAAQECAYSEEELRRYVNTGQLPTERNSRGRLVLRRRVWQKWLKSRRHASQLDPEQRYWSLEEIAEKTGMLRDSVGAAIRRKQLKAQLVQVPDSARPAYRVADRHLKSWLKKRDRGLPAVQPRGEVLTLERAVEHSGMTREQLYYAVRHGELPAAKEHYRGAKRWLFGTIDLDDWVRRRSQPKDWTCRSLAEFAGVSYAAVLAAEDRGELKLDDSGVLDWLIHRSPPYRPEVAHLENCVSFKAALKLSRVLRPVLVKALQSGELGALVEQNQGSPRYYIPRFQLDSWLESRGLAPSWQLAAETEWLRVADAATLTGYARPTIQLWIRQGKVVSRRRGRRWLVERQSLLAQAEATSPRTDRNQA